MRSDTSDGRYEYLTKISAKAAAAATAAAAAAAEICGSAAAGTNLDVFERFWRFKASWAFLDVSGRF